MLISCQRICYSCELQQCSLLEDAQHQVHKCYICKEKSVKKLYKFSAYFGRMGSIEGIFPLTDEEYNFLFGKQIYFGEVLGKHSEIYCRIKENNLTMLTDDQDFIEKFIKYKCSSGHNPLDYLENEFEEEEN